MVAKYDQKRNHAYKRVGGFWAYLPFEWFLDKIYSSDHGLLYCNGLTYSRQQAKQKGLFKLTTFLTE